LRRWPADHWSTQCEGQHFATAELKAFTSLFLSTFELELVSPVDKPTFGELYEPIELAGVDKPGFRPRRIPGRGASSALAVYCRAHI